MMRNINISISEFQGQTVLMKVQGRVSALTSRRFQSEAMRYLPNNNDRHVIFDASDITYISTAGIRAILLLSKELSLRDRRFYICNLRPYILEVFQILGFDKIIAIYPDIDSVLGDIQAETS